MILPSVSSSLQVPVCFIWHRALYTSVTVMGGFSSCNRFFLSYVQYVLSFSNLFSFMCFDVTVLSAIVVKFRFISSGQMSFTVDECFGVSLFVSWLITLQTNLEFCLEHISSSCSKHFFFAFHFTELTLFLCYLYLLQRLFTSN